ncbi:MAG: helix-turn-helix domain-containing protein [Tissierellaceae bacterium]|nr:helix-turn-helix domain-containing protein [Tissierellaceae bacterium]
MNEKYLKNFIPLMNYMSELHGIDTEIILYDIEKMNVYHIINPFDDEIKVGAKIRSLERKFLEDKLYEKEDYIVNYRALSSSKDKLKSATFFLKNTNDVLYGILTINQKVERLIELRNIIDEMIQGKQPYDQVKGASFYDSFDISVTDIVTNVILDEIAKLNIPVDRLTTQEKIKLTQTLDHMGIFLVKGAISNLANKLDTTETTIYRYLNQKQN